MEKSLSSLEAPAISAAPLREVSRRLVSTLRFRLSVMRNVRARLWMLSTSSASEVLP